MDERDRIIGRHIGTEPGPLMICLGGIHGNEPAGVQAIEVLLEMLRIEPMTNPDFEFRGVLVGFRGNLQAIDQGVRFIEKDLNRSLASEHVEHVLGQNVDELTAEDKEIHGLVNAVRNEIRDFGAEHIIVLDLHTTTATGGIFTLTADDHESISIGVELHAPVIIGFEQMLAGTTMGFFKPSNFDGKHITSVVFESGQHNDPLSVNRAIAAMINCMRTIGCVNAEDVENRHDHLLIEYSDGLPSVAKLVERYDVSDVSRFEMAPGLQNFDNVKKGQILATDNGQPVMASKDSMIIMPKYQQQGNDGFFLVERQNGAASTIL